MKDKWPALVRFWARTFGIGLLSILVYQLIPRFGRLVGDLELRCDGLSIPLMSCALLAAAVTGVWAYRNWQNL